MFSTRFVSVRKRRHLTQKAFAQMLGINERTIWRLERGGMPHPDTLERISQGLGIDAHEWMSVAEWDTWKARWPAEAIMIETRDEKAPLCLCGCGELVTRVTHTRGDSRKGAWGRYKRGHWGKWTGVPHTLSATDRNEYMRLYRLANLEEQQRKDKQKYQVLKRTVIAAYSNNTMQCACCGEAQLEFLTIDHIIPLKRKGAMRKDAGTGLYARLRAAGFPSGFQVLCFNCNCAKRTYSTCPHQACIPNY